MTDNNIIRRAPELSGDFQRIRDFAKTLTPTERETFVKWLCGEPPRTASKNELRTSRRIKHLQRVVVKRLRATPTKSMHLAELDEGLQEKPGMVEGEFLEVMRTLEAAKFIKYLPNGRVGVTE